MLVGEIGQLVGPDAGVEEDTVQKDEGLTGPFRNDMDAATVVDIDIGVLETVR